MRLRDCSDTIPFRTDILDDQTETLLTIKGDVFHMMKKKTETQAARQNK